MSRKIIGVTVGSPLPKPNLKQTDPRRGDYVKGKDIIPTKVSQLENDSGYLTEVDKQKIAEMAAELVEVPESGGNVDLTGVVKSVNGQTPDENGNVTIEVGSGGSGGVKADWNQSDPEQPDYIRNKPFYKETGNVYVLTETEVNCTGSVLKFPPEVAPETANSLFTPGNVIMVDVDGVTYEEVCKDYEEMAMLRGNYIGNAGLGHYYNDDTGEPFFIEISAETSDIRINFAKSGAYTVSVYGVAENLKQIDLEYLPKHVATAVSYKNQELDDGQKQTARHNIGATQTGYEIYDVFEDIPVSGLEIPVENFNWWNWYAMRLYFSNGSGKASVLISKPDYDENLRFRFDIGNDTPEEVRGYIRYNPYNVSLIVCLNERDGGDTIQLTSIHGYIVEYIY